MSYRVTLIPGDGIGPEVAAAAVRVLSATGADDSLGLYLKQMGAIPLLNRDAELALAMRLETTRRRYRRAVLFNWIMVRRVWALFRRILAGDVPVDPNIDVVTSLGLTREHIVARMPYLVRTLGKVLETARLEFRVLWRTKSEAGRARFV